MKIQSLMIVKPITIGPHASVSEAIELMKANSIRHLPVVDSGNRLAGFLTLADPTDVVYKVTAYHKPGCEHSIRWDDPTIGIAWPLEGSRPLLSARDREAPLLTDAEVYD